MKTVCVFDSGVGGLSVLRALLADSPGVRFVYLADSANAPYGERGAAWVQDRSHRIVASLQASFSPDAIVVACNTATALAIDSLRQAYPDLPLVGVEPALKPAAALTLTGHIGVMATRGTLESDRFAKLRYRLEHQGVHPPVFHCIPCDGLADAIERDDRAAIRILAERYVGLLHPLTTAAARVDTVVLGCTHYPFINGTLTALTGPGVTLVETGAPVARRTREILHLMASPMPLHPVQPLLLTTGNTLMLETLAGRWLGLNTPATPWRC